MRLPYGLHPSLSFIKNHYLDYLFNCGTDHARAPDPWRGEPGVGHLLGNKGYFIFSSFLFSFIGTCPLPYNNPHSVIFHSYENMSKGSKIPGLLHERMGKGNMALRAIFS